MHVGFIPHFQVIADRLYNDFYLFKLQMVSYLKTIRSLVTVLLFTCCTAYAQAQQWDDKVLISQCDEQYTLTFDGDKPIVKNIEKITYQSNSVTKVMPETTVFYGEFISLDNISGHGQKQYTNVTPENVFYDDTKACTVQGEISKKGKTSSTSFERTFKDIKYFTRVYLLEEYFIQHKTLTITIPKKLAGYRLKEMNFEGYNIQVAHESTPTDEVYRYTMTNCNRMKEDAQMPPSSSVYPYLLIIGPFADVNALYSWSMKMADVDCNIPNLQSLLAEINKTSKTPEDRISNTYRWVQDNIRYIAYEAGIAGHRPDTPAEVLRKRYGDCKGMALLLTTLLKAQGFDARWTDIGTEEIPFKMSDVPTLAGADHVICTLLYKGKTYFIDATCKHIPYTYTPQGIQGSQAMIANGDRPRLEIVPVRKPDESIDSLSYNYQLQGDALVGTATYMTRGDMKEWFMSVSDNVGSKHNDDLLANNLNSDAHNMMVSDVKWVDDDPRHEWGKFTGKVVNKPAVQQADGELYIEMNPHNNLFDARIDTTQRTHDYYLPVRCNVVRQAVLTIPAGYRVDYLPSSATFNTPEGTLTCRFVQNGNVITFHQKMQINHRQIPLKNIPQWNDALRKWTDACNEQVVLKRR